MVRKQYKVTNADTLMAVGKRTEITPPSPYEVINALVEQVRQLKDLLRASRRENALQLDANLRYAALMLKYDIAIPDELDDMGLVA